MKRIGNIELIKSKSFGKESTEYYEIVKWQKNNDKREESSTIIKETCYTLLIFKNSSEGPEIEFVGNRPFDIEEKEDLWELMKYGQKIAEAEWKIENYIKHK